MPLAATIASVDLKAEVKRSLKDVRIVEVKTKVPDKNATPKKLKPLIIQVASYVPIYFSE